MARVGFPNSLLMSHQEFCLRRLINKPQAPQSHVRVPQEFTDVTPKVSLNDTAQRAVSSSLACAGFPKSLPMSHQEFCLRRLNNKPRGRQSHTRVSPQVYRCHTKNATHGAISSKLISHTRGFLQQLTDVTPGVLLNDTAQ